jgi:hypothetical protein
MSFNKIMFTSEFFWGPICEVVDGLEILFSRCLILFLNVLNPLPVECVSLLHLFLGIMLIEQGKIGFEGGIDPRRQYWRIVGGSRDKG